VSTLLGTEESNSFSSSSTGLVDAGLILEVIPYPVALWSLDRRSCIFNHPSRELLGGLTHDIGNNLQTISGELELSRWSGVLSVESAEAMARGITQIRTLAHEIEEYLFPSKHRPRTEDPASLLTEVIQSKEKEMAAHGIRTGIIVKEALPKVP